MRRHALLLVVGLACPGCASAPPANEERPTADTPRRTVAVEEITIIVAGAE